MADFEGFPKETFAFLRALAKNNKKAWFDAHKQDYEDFYLAPGKAFVEALTARLKKRVGGGSMMRIYRDTRFSKDKRPYKDHLDMFFWQGKTKSWDVPGYYMRLEANSVWLGAGVYYFVDAKQIAAYRKRVVDAKRGKELVAILSTLEKLGYDVGGKELKKVPRGFDPEQARAELLKHKGLYAMVEAKPKDAHTKKFVSFAQDHFDAMEPLNAWLR